MTALPVQIVLLALEALLAVVALRVLRRRVLPVVHALRHPEAAVDVWLPLAMVAPLIVLGARVHGPVDPGGWPALGGPVAAAWAALAATLVATSPSASGRPGGWPLVAAGMAGAVLLLLAAAHVMTVIVGQCALATAAVLLWIATPGREPGPPPVESGAAGGLAAALACGLGMGGLALAVDGRLAPVAAGLVLGYVAMVACALPIAGGAAARRIAAWSAAYGVLLALGVAALRTMLPAAVQIVAGFRGPPPDAVAYGFGSLAPEACALLVLGPALMGADRLMGRPRRWLGVTLLVAVAGLIGWRLAGG